MKVLQMMMVISLLASTTACASSSDRMPINTQEPGKQVHQLSDDKVTSSMKEEKQKVLQFGSYWKDSQSVAPIEWIVLHEKDDALFLVAKYCIDSIPWHTTSSPTTWDNSHIREWLNGEFLRTAFTEEEAHRILVTHLDNGDDMHYGTPVGKDTDDKIFLLSTEEVGKYLPLEENRRVSPTAYANERGVFTNPSGDSAWWLRSPGTSDRSPSYLASSGRFGNRGHEAGETVIGIRPALWIHK